MNSTLNINWEQLSLVVGDEENPADDEMKDLYRLFVDDAGRRLRGLAELGTTFDRTNIAKEAHKIRGAAASFGFDQVAAILKVVELQITELMPERTAEMIREANAIFEQSSREVLERFPALAT